MENIVTLTIDENGDATFLDTPGTEIFLDLGKSNTQRASHVEPVNFALRVAFYVLRWFGDKNKIAEWTRNWNCGWRVNTSPVGGPILTWSHVHPRVKFMYPDLVYVWRDRREAIAAEIAFLNEFFLERK